MANITGNDTSETILDTAGGDIIHAGAGDDFITVTSGFYDQVFGDAGDDTLKFQWGYATSDVLVQSRDSGGGKIIDPANPGSNLATVWMTGIEHVDVTSGSGNDELRGTSNSWDRFDGNAGVDSWIDSFTEMAAPVAIKMDKISTNTGQTLSDGTFLRNVEIAKDLTLTRGDDTFRDHGNFDDFVNGFDGDDVLRSSGGKDHMTGYFGNDTLIIDWSDDATGAFVENNLSAYAWVRDGTDFYDSSRSVDFDIFENLEVYTGSGDDELQGGDSIDRFVAGAGNDQLSGFAGDDRLAGNEGNDRIDGGNGADTLLGGKGRDTLTGGAGGDTIDGQRGIDTASYAASTAGVDVDLLAGTSTGGDAEGDTLANIENLVGSAFADTLTGDAGANRLSGGDMGDRLDGKGDMDVLRGGAGRDVLLGSGGSDVLFGESGSDRLKGGTQGDILFGGRQADKLFGQGGDDRLDGGAGNDELTGGTGRDVFVFASGQDRITDFTNNRDTIELDGAALGLSGLTVADVLATATVVNGNTEIGFSTGDTLVIEGLTNINALTDDMSII
jgi:Ca2+-binding RTX toxin-like protein